jgi:hypothetical protein
MKGERPGRRGFSDLQRTRQKRSEVNARLGEDAGHEGVRAGSRLSRGARALPQDSEALWGPIRTVILADRVDPIALQSLTAARMAFTSSSGSRWSPQPHPLLATRA